MRYASIPTMVLAAASMAAAVEQWSFTPLDDECDGDFCVRTKFTRLVNVRANDEARIAFCRQESGDAYHVVLRGNRLRVVRLMDGTEAALADWRPLPATEEGFNELIVQRAGGDIRVIAGARIVATARDGSFHSGHAGTWSSSPRIIWNAATLQPMEPVYFTDEFMREGDQHGNWERVSGNWGLRGIRGEPKPPPAEQTSNPFAYEGVPGEGAPAIATVGYWFWHGYSVAAAVRPQGRGACGLCAYHLDELNYLAFRWTVGLSSGVRQLVRVRDGEETVLDESPGGYEEGQWYWIELRASGSEVVAFIDGQEVCRAGNTAFGMGRAGLLVSDKGTTARFDDVHVVTRGADEGPLSPPLDTRVPDHYVNDEIMKRWTTEEWSWKQAEDETFWHHGRFFTDSTLEIVVEKPLPDGARLWGIVSADDRDQEHGYRLDVAGGKDAAKWALCRQGKEVASADGPRPSAKDVPVRLVCVGSRVESCLGDQTVLSYEDPAPLVGKLVGIGSSAGNVSLAASSATCAHARDWTFSKAPVAFRVARGLWEIEPHWACTGKGAHFYGLDEYGASVLWTKDVLEGDFVLEAIASNADFQVRGGEYIPKHLGVTVGGDGCDLSSGYTFALGVGEAGKSERETLLLHGGEVLARAASRTNRKAEHNKNNWVVVRVEKTGNKLRLLVEGEVECEHEVADGLPAGRLAFWSYQGGIVLGRVRLWYEGTAPQPATPEAVVEVDRLVAGSPLDDLEAEPSPEQPSALSLDFEKNFGTVTTRDTPDSALAALDDSTAAAGKRSLKIVNPTSGGNFALWITSAPVAVAPGTVLEFDYRVPPEVKLNLYLSQGAKWHEVRFAAGPKDEDGAAFANVTTDGQWHHARLDLYPLLTKDEATKPESVTVDQIAFASPSDFLLRCGFTGNRFGATWHLDNFRIGKGTG